MNDDEKLGLIMILIGVEGFGASLPLENWLPMYLVSIGVVVFGILLFYNFFEKKDGEETLQGS